MQCKAQLCILRTSHFKLAPPLPDNPQGMQQVVSDFELILFVSNTKQRFLSAVTSDICMGKHYIAALLIVLLGLQYVPCMAYLS